MGFVIDCAGGGFCCFRCCSLLIYRCFSVLAMGFTGCFDSVFVGLVCCGFAVLGCCNIALILGGWWLGLAWSWWVTLFWLTYLVCGCSIGFGWVSGLVFDGCVWLFSGVWPVFDFSWFVVRLALTAISGFELAVDL